MEDYTLHESPKMLDSVFFGFWFQSGMLRLWSIYHWVKQMNSSLCTCIVFVPCCSVAQSCPTLCSPMDCSISGFPVLHYILESAQTHVHWVSDAIQTISSSVIPFSSCLLSFPASGSFPMSQLFISGGQSIGASASASVLLKNIQGWFPLGLTGLSSLLSKGLSRVFSKTTVWNHQFFGTQPSLWTNSHIHTWLLEKP